jgi:CDP-glucose 4,6-dehydratase
MDNPLSLPQEHFLEKFKGARVFITGHTGFKGSWLTFILTELGADITGYALPPTSKEDHFNLLDLETRIHHVEGDIRDYGKLKAALDECQPEYVFHLAAQAIVKSSYEDPVYSIQTNVLGSTYLLEAVRHQQSVRSLVYVTSDKCYENVEWIWGYRENDMLGGIDPYSASKACAEILFSSYQRSFFIHRPELGAASVRAGNVIGGGDWAADRIVPDCIRAFRQNEAVKLRNPSATRPWQHVLEPLSGYMLLATRLFESPGKWAGSWNFGPSSRMAKTVKDVADTLTQELGFGTVEIEEANNTAHEAQLLQLNCDKAHQLLGWYPSWDVDKTLKETASWYSQVLKGKAATEVTRCQIMNYFGVEK